MTTLSFYNGLREIGGTFVVVETEKARCMFDFGFAVAARMDDKIRKRTGCIAADYARLGMLTPIDGIYDKQNAQLLGKKAYGEMEKECFFLISHMHIDHMGGLGMLHPDIPVYMSEDSLRLYRHLADRGDIQEDVNRQKKAHATCKGVPFGGSFTVGDITVQILQIEHDVVGASGFLIQTPEGTVCYTGDYRFHGFHPDITKAFAEKVKGVDVLITEGVTVSFDDIVMLSLTEPIQQERTEEDLIKEMQEVSRKEKGLLVINPYNRNVERIHRLNEALCSSGRTLVMDDVQADYVAEFYPEDEIHIYEPTMHMDKKSVKTGTMETKTLYVTREDVLAHPQQFVLELDYADMNELIDLHPVVSCYIQMDGSPLGDYDPSFSKMHSLLEYWNIPYENLGLGGHARPYYLKSFLDTVAPKTLIPLHSFRPEQVQSERAECRILPEYGDCYQLVNGRLIKCER